MVFEESIGLLGAIVGAIIGAIISSLVVMFYGERWVEMSRRRREHSIKLKDEVLKPWLTKIEEYCKVGAVYAHEVDKLVAVMPKDPTDLEFFDEAKSHLESKYPDILKDWKELKLTTLTHNGELTAFLEEIRALIVKEINMPCYYWGMRGDVPEKYVMPDRIALHAYEIIIHEIRTGRKWFGGKPNVQPVTYGDVTFYELRWWNDPTLVKSRDKKEAEECMPLIRQLVESPKYRDKTKDLLKKVDEGLRPKCEKFEEKMRDLIKSVELGNILKGKCRYCP